MKFLKRSLIMWVMNVFFFVLIMFLTQNAVLAAGLFLLMTLLFPGIAWMIHIQYLRNDRAYEVLSEHGYRVLLDKRTGEKRGLSGETVLAINYYRRMPFGSEEGFLAPAFSGYYFLEIRFRDGHSILLSCLMGDTLIFDTKDFKFVNDRLVFIRKNIPFLPSGRRRGIKTL